MYAERNGSDGGDQYGVGVTEHDPKPDPSGCKAQVHRIPHVAIKTNYHQSLRRHDGRWRTPSRPAEVPDAAQSHRKSHYRRNYCQPSPTRSGGCFHAEA